MTNGEQIDLKTELKLPNNLPLFVLNLLCFIK
jgi:hypothetical protein